MQDIRLAVRALRKTPIVTAVALLTLALGIGANTAIFSFINGLLLAPLPYPHPDRLVSLWERAPSGRRNAMTTLNYLDYAHSPVFEKIAATTGCCGGVILGTTSEPTPVGTLHVSAAYFDILGGHAALGRTFIAGEDQPGHDHVVVISHKLWVSRFGADPSLVGHAIRVNGEPYTLIGIMSDEGPFGRADGMWLPLSFPPERMIRSNHWLLSLTGGGVGLLKPGITVEQARAELETIAARMSRDHPETNSGWGVIVEPFGSRLVSDDLRHLLLLLLAAVVVVLLIGCVNVANVALARGLAREREMAIRRALGASRRRLIRQFLTEALVLSSTGGVIGIAVGYLMMVGLKAAIAAEPMNPSFIPYLLPTEFAIAIDHRVLLFTVVMSLASGIGFSLLPAMRNTRPTTETSAGLHRQASTPGANHTGQAALVVLELALAVVLLTSAGLMLRSFLKMHEADTGFTGTNVLTASLPIWEHRFADDDGLRAYQRQLTAAIEEVPGVRDVALTDGLPLQGTPFGQFFQIVGQPIVDTARRPTCSFKRTTPAYFRAMGLRVREGRGLVDTDRFGSQYVTVINETMARSYFPNVDPIGQQLLLQERRPGTNEEIAWTIVGVIANERMTPFDDPQQPSVAYVPIDQSPTTFAGLVVRAAGDPDSLRESIRRAVTGVDKDQAVSDMRTVDQLEADAMAPDWLRTWCVSLFAGVALLLSAIGIYGVFAYAVVRRTHEIGIRAALGARSEDLVWLILRQGLALNAVGLALGILGAFGVARLLRAFLFGVGPADPIAIIAAAVLLTAIAIVASYIPARRAAQIDPLQALRAE